MKDFSREHKNQIIIQLQDTADNLTKFARLHNSELSEDEFNVIKNTFRKLLSVADQLTASVLGEIGEELNKRANGIKDATDIANNALKTLSDIRKAIKIAGALLDLAFAIADRSPGKIKNSVQSIIDIVNAD